MTTVTGEPAWAVASLFPSQGAWDEDDYLALSDAHPRVELSDGCLEVLPEPTERHQLMLLVLFRLLDAYAVRIGGRALTSGIRVRVNPGVIREPDVAFLAASGLGKRGRRFWTGANLVVEVVSEGLENQIRDRVKKRAEYAGAGIREYWLADTVAETFTVLTLRDGQYAEHGVYRRGDTVASPGFEGLVVDVSAVLDAD